jgi:hypothetical protein
VTLVADLSDRPVRWERIASIPFGEGVQELGVIHDRRVGSLAFIPRSFAIDPNGSIWILDFAKRRIAHYSRDGRYLGRILVAPGPRTTLRDITVIPSGMVILTEAHPETYTIESRLALAGGGSDEADLTWITPRGESKLVYVSQVFPSTIDDLQVIGTTHAYRDYTPVGFEYAGFDMTGSGDAQFLPGIPLGHGEWAKLTGTSDQGFEVTFGRPDAITVQPIHVRVVTDSGPNGKEIGAIVGPGIEAGLPGAVGIEVELSPTRPRDAKRYGGGRWYLQLGPKGQPLVWEPIVYGLHQQEEQVRHLATGPDGSVYLMVLTRHGEVIYRRP